MNKKEWNKESEWERERGIRLKKEKKKNVVHKNQK